MKKTSDRSCHGAKVVLLAMTMLWGLVPGLAAQTEQLEEARTALWYVAKS